MLSIGRKAVPRKRFCKQRVSEVGQERAAASTPPSPSPPPLQHTCLEGWEPAPPASHAHLRDMQAPGGSGHPGSPSCPIRHRASPQCCCRNGSGVCARAAPSSSAHTASSHPCTSLTHGHTFPHRICSLSHMVCNREHHCSVLQCRAAGHCPAFLGCSETAARCASGSLLLSFSRQNSDISQLLTAL